MLMRYNKPGRAVTYTPKKHLANWHVQLFAIS